MKKIITLAACTLLFGAGCTPTIKTQNEVTIKPVQVTLDINLKIDQEIADAMNTPAAPPKTAAATAAAERRERMMARRTLLNEAKAAEWIGENNAGLIEFRITPSETGAEVQAAVAAENKDRQEIFRTIAERQNTTAEVVGRRFAARVAERARVGTLRQTAEGNWITVTGE